MKEKVKYLIIINETLDEKCHKELILIGRTLQYRDATFVLNDPQKGKYNLLSIIPEIDEKSCKYRNDVTTSIVNICTNGILKGDVVYPAKKPKNLKKCPFNVAMATMYPYSMIKNTKTLQNLQHINESQIRGSDLEIIKIISNYYNASLNLYYIYREEESPYLHLEYVPFLLNGSFDACAGGLYRIYGDLVYYSGIYTRQAVIWVYTVERDSRSWQTVVSKINGLYIFVLFYICYSIIWMLFCKFDHIMVSYSNTFLYSWGALIGTASLQDSRTWKQKILNISYLVLCLHLSAYISIQLFSFFTILGPPQTLKTNNEVMASGKTAYLNFETKFFVEDEKYKAFANTSQNCANFKDCEEKTIAYKGVTAIPEGYFYPFQAETAVDNEARILRPVENILLLYHEMIVRKESPFSDNFEMIVKRLFEAGICNRLYLEAIGLLTVAKAESAFSNILANSYHCESGCPITLLHIAGAFYVWAIGCGVSFFTFIMEIMMKKQLKTDN
ncbi:uncharacterized protein [Battus philenor]|uniref:uncharacterized protein n=1 Tax=Battus philenor TaxID=42288 RepID=UPI0035CF0C98